MWHRENPWPFKHISEHTLPVDHRSKNMWTKEYTAGFIPRVVEGTMQGGACSLSFSGLMTVLPLLLRLHFWKAAAWSRFVLESSSVEWAELPRDKGPETEPNRIVRAGVYAPCWQGVCKGLHLALETTACLLEPASGTTAASFLVVTGPSLWSCQVPLNETLSCTN